jgi:membrane-anchored mycosin MYCP
MSKSGPAARRVAAVVLAATLAGLGPVVTAGAAAAAAPTAAGQNCVAPGKTITTTPWPQQMLAPQRTQHLSNGSGVTVAVLDSGVDATTQPQLRKQIYASTDFIDPKSNGRTDCTGHGTQVAGIIAAVGREPIAFRGLAPAAHLVSARVSDSEGETGLSAGTTGLAHAIDWAVQQQHADIINISLTTAADDQPLRDAVARAEAAGTVIIAAAGNKGAPTDGNPVLYPAAYPGVIGVGAIDPTGHRWPGSEHRNYVDLVAPGADLISTQAGGGVVDGLNGTSYAAAFVTGTAALVLSRDPGMNPHDLANRLYATATPAPGGLDSTEYGHGIVNPYSAVVDLTTGARPGVLPGLSPSPADPAEVARTAAWSRSGRLAGTLTGIGILLALVVLAASRALPLGRRRRWRASLAPAVRDNPEAAAVSPPLQLFDDET